LFELDLDFFASLQQPHQPFFPAQELAISRIGDFDRISLGFLELQRKEDVFKSFKGMEADLLEIQEFGNRLLIMEISVVQRDDGIDHRILEIPQIEFYDRIDEDVGIRKTCEIVFPKRCFFDPIRERKMEFLDGFLIRSERISLFQGFHQFLGHLRIGEISEEPYLPD